MASITKTKKRDRRTGKDVVQYRAFIRRTVNGKPVSKSKVFATKLEAQTWVANNENDKALELAAVDADAKARNIKGPTFAALIDAFVKTPPAAGTRYWAPSHLDFWKAELGALRPTAIGKAEINATKAKLQTKKAQRNSPDGVKELDKTITAATVNRYLASLSSVLNYAVDIGVLEAHPMRGRQVRKLKEGKGRRRVLTEAEELRLLEEADRSTWPLMGLYLRIMLTTAARKSEVLNLRWRDVHLDRRVAILHDTKNGEARALPLVSEVRDLLREQKKVNAIQGDFVFFDPKHPERPKNIDTLWKFVRQRAGLWQDRDDPLDRVVLHSTRHTGVTKMIRGGANLAQAARVSGHKTLAMLKRYEHLAADDAVDLAERLLGKKAS